jgi:hypothetical protein
MIYQILPNHVRDLRNIPLKTRAWRVKESKKYKSPLKSRKTSVPLALSPFDSCPQYHFSLAVIAYSNFFAFNDLISDRRKRGCYMAL